MESDIFKVMGFKRVKHCIVMSESNDYYVIPEDKRGEFEEWDLGDYDLSEDHPVPEWAEYVNNFSDVTFGDYEV